MNKPKVISKEDFEKILEQNRTLHKLYELHHDKSDEYSHLVIDGFEDRINGNLYEIRKYVEQLESKIKEYEELSNKQIVARTYSHDQCPNGLDRNTEELENYLNKGCSIVMVNKVQDGIIEYILEKQSK